MVMISHDKKFVFLKTRKTGGTSFEMLLEPWCAPPGHIVTEAAKELVTDYGIVGARLNKLKEKPKWRNHIGEAPVAEFLGAEKWAAYCKLTSVRNPFSRAVSQFYWQFVWQKRDVPQDLVTNQALFHNYIFSNMFKSDKHIAHIKDEFILDDAIRLEHIDDDLARIGARLALPLSREALPRTKENAGAKPDFDRLALFTPEIEAEIRRKEAWVFEHWDYSPKASDAYL